GIILLIITKGKFAWPETRNIKLIVIAGIFNSLMSMCFIYSANPLRTPILIQSIFLGLAILPSVLFRRLLITKTILYDMNYIMSSLILLLLSILISLTPYFDSKTNKFSFWIFGYILAIILMSFDNVMQEKYSENV